MPFEIGLGGVNNSYSQLQVLSHNLANLSTTGFKATNRVFSPVNAFGSSVINVNPNFSQGELTPSSSTLDLAIDGSGFFALNTGTGLVYSRAGAFTPDNEGYLVNSIGQRLTGFSVDHLGKLTQSVGDIQLPLLDNQALATAKVSFDLNLDARSEAPTTAFVEGFTATTPPQSDSFNFSVSQTLYDSLGAEHTVTAFFIRDTDTPNTYAVRIGIDGVDFTPEPNTTLTFSTSGLTQNAAPISIEFLPGNGAAPQTLELDFSQATLFGSPNAIRNINTDGFGIGSLERLNIEADGAIHANFSNGQSQVVGQVLLANFNSPSSLNAIGNSNYTASVASGVPQLSHPGHNNTGFLVAGFLEMGNTATTDSLLGLLHAQRDFNASAQVLNVASTNALTVITLIGNSDI